MRKDYLVSCILYLNDLPNISAHLKFFLFADDTNIYFESDDLIKLEKTVNKELQKLYLPPLSKSLRNKFYNFPPI